MFDSINAFLTKLFLSSSLNHSQIADIIAKIDKKNSDLFGPDPFHLRNGDARHQLQVVQDNTNAQFLPKIEYSFEEIIAKYSKIQQRDHKPVLQKQTAKNLVPKYVNEIWLGGPFVNPIHWERLLKWKQHTKAAGYKVILWTDQNDFSQGANKEMLAWCEANEIELINFNEVFSQKTPLEPYYRFEHFRACWGGASDIARLAILAFGGIYADTDIWPKEDIGDITIDNEIGFLLSLNTMYDGFRSAPINNDYIMTLPNSKGIELATKYVIGNYKLQAKELLHEISPESPSSSEAFSYNSKPMYVHTIEFIKNRTMNLTGPNMYLLHDEFRELNVKVDDTKVHMHNEGSWYKASPLHKVKYREFKNEKEALQHVLTWILCDLQI